MKTAGQGLPTVSWGHTLYGQYTVRCPPTECVLDVEMSSGRSIDLKGQFEQRFAGYGVVGQAA